MEESCSTTCTTPYGLFSNDGSTQRRDYSDLNSLRLKITCVSFAKKSQRPLIMLFSDTGALVDCGISVAAVGMYLFVFL